MPQSVSPQFTVLRNIEFGPNPRGLSVLKIFEESKFVQSVLLERPYQFVEVVRHSFVLLDSERTSFFRFQPACDPAFPEILRQSHGVYLVGHHVCDESSVRSIASNILADAQMLLGDPTAFHRLRSLPRIPSGAQSRC